VGVDGECGGGEQDEEEDKDSSSIESGQKFRSSSPLPQHAKEVDKRRFQPRSQY
jgi:hypothetical protein